MSSDGFVRVLVVYQIDGCFGHDDIVGFSKRYTSSKMNLLNDAGSL